MDFIISIIRVVIDYFMSKYMIRAIVSTATFFGVSNGYAAWIALIVFVYLIVFNKKTRTLYNLVREYILHWVCKAISLVVHVPENLYGARYAKGF